MDAAQELLHTYLTLQETMLRYLCARYRGAGQTDLQCVVLALLECDGPQPVSALAEHTGCANSTVSGVIDRLERAGAVRRVRSDADRRVVLVEATQAGRSPDRGALFDRTRETLTPDQLRGAVQALGRLTAALDGEYRAITEQRTEDHHAES